MFDRMKEHLDRFGAPDLDWIQVEVTTCCNSSCIYCPHSATECGLPKRHMPVDLFCRLLPFIRFTRMIYLQGWGEPLLHPDLFKIIRICKNKKKYVGLTTNGMELSEKNIHRILDSGLDILGVSLAGVTAASHNRFRSGTDFDVVIENIRRVKQIKAERNSALPDLHLAVMMLKSNFHEMLEIVPLARELGAEQIVASNLSLILDKSLSAEALFDDADKAGRYSEVLESIKTTAAAEGMVFSYSRPDLNESETNCSENVCHACVVNVDGDVTPCVFLDPVLTADHRKGDNNPSYYRLKDRMFPLKGMSFGNIQNENLTRIWRKKAYVRFRGCFDSDEAAMPHGNPTALPDMCRFCFKRLTGYQ